RRRARQRAGRRAGVVSPLPGIVVPRALLAHRHAAARRIPQRSQPICAADLIWEARPRNCDRVAAARSESGRAMQTSEPQQAGVPMSNKGQLLQDPFLNLLRREHVPVSIYLVNGIKLQGQIDSFDQYVVLLRNTVTQMVYKH